MNADQVLYTGGEPQRREAVAELHYDDVEDHGHWHYRAFMTFELLDLEGQVVRADAKAGFCLVDSYNADPETTVPGEPELPTFVNGCGEGEPDLRDITVGISVGYGDRYLARLADQWIDIKGLPPGRYQLVHTANPTRALAEASYDNNAASVLIEVAPGGPGMPPTVEVLRECPDTPTCLPVS
jgi:hypothetical protein